MSKYLNESVNILLNSIGYFEYKDKVEEYYEILDAYEHFNDTHFLGIYRKEEIDEDYDI